jgi:flavin-dependent dehydrogenase
MPCPGARIVQRISIARQFRLRILERGISVIESRGLLVVGKSGSFWRIAYEKTTGGWGTLKTRYLVDATGRSCVVARSRGARRQTADRLCSFSLPIRTASLIGTWTEAVAEGWWNLCSDGNQATLSFQSFPSIIRKVRHDVAAHLAQTQEIKRLVTTLPADRTESRVRPCGSSRLAPAAGEGWIAVGDAAMTVQPLAAAGIANALRDARFARQALERDPQQYDRLRRAEFDRYLECLARQYALENRWPQSSFWQQTARYDRRR